MQRACPSPLPVPEATMSSSTATLQGLFLQRDENYPVHFPSYSHKFTGPKEGLLTGGCLIPPKLKTRSESTQMPCKNQCQRSSR